MFDERLLRQASAAQGLALEPAASVWISASAGTGKTEVLTRRMLALLLSDPTLEPKHILALTFTKAGAAEMAARLPARLAKWAALDEATLAVEISDFGLRTSDFGDVVVRVRTLAEAVRTAPPLVATIHALAQQVLGRFAVEAGLPPQFEVLEDGARVRMLRDIQHDLLVNVEGPLAGVLGTLLDELGDYGWDDLTGLVVGNWGRLEGVFAHGGLAAVLERLETELGLRNSEFGDAAAPLGPTTEEWAALRRVVGLFPEHKARLVLEAPEALREDAWRGFLLTTADTPRARLFVKAEVAALDEMDVALVQEAAARVAEQVRMRKVWRGYEVTKAALVWAAAVQAAYVQRKQRGGWVDYTDLLNGLERLLDSDDPQVREWVWYGLDRRFRHLVVDEAQDNNAQQDRIIRRLAQSILSGDVGEGAARTVLAVGDMKQSIFRFQGAVPELFVSLREVLRDWAPTLREVDLGHSFRSGKHVLEAVDRVFAAEDTGEIVVGEDYRDWPAHVAVAAGRGSRVEVWPLVQAAEVTKDLIWALPEVRAAAEGHGADITCLRQVGAWLQQQVGRVVMPSTGKPLMYDDVMIVVQRNKIAGLAAGVLRGMGIPVASGGGVQPLAVEDVVAALRVVFNPEDNLCLAQVLKGFLGWDDAGLLALAEKASKEPWWPFVEGEDRVWLEGILALRWEAPLRIVQRLIRELRADERVLEGLLAWAEQAESLRELVARLELEDLPVAGSGTGVRVLTVHGSKGLQAPLVILPDTMAALGDVGRDTLLWGGDVVLFKQAKGLSALEDRLAEDEKKRRTADNLRGLYVAMTRAQDWLVVTGFGKLTETTDTWWTRVARGTEEPRNQGTKVFGEEFAYVEKPVAVEALDTPPLPAWVRGAVAAPVVRAAGTVETRRGEALHALLQLGTRNEVARNEDEQEALRVRAALPWLWAKGFRSEVAVAVNGRVGRIDRIVEHDGALWLVDFKTGKVPDDGGIPAKYMEQLSGYAAALRATYPQAKIRAGIVWTAAARLDEVPLEW